MAVNGIEIKVGQVWGSLNGFTGKVLTPEHNGVTDCAKFPILVAMSDGAVRGFTAAGTYNTDGTPGNHLDLVELIQDTLVELDAIYEHVRSAEELSAAASPDPAPQAVELLDAVFPDISEGDRAAGRVKLSECYVEKKPGTSAPELLDAAAGHMRDRAATYDKPAGERSIAQVVTAFNAIHGMQLTEAQGWHFMSLLKQVRAFAGKAHRDSVEDNVAYAALMGEAMLKGGAQ